MLKLHPKDRYIETWRKEISPRLRMLYWQARARWAETILKVCFKDRKKKRAEHFALLEDKVKAQAFQIKQMQDRLQYRNKQMKALNILVACNGPCNAPYMDDPSQVDQGVVDIVNYTAKRLNDWWNRGGMKAREEYLNKYKRKN